MKKTFKKSISILLALLMIMTTFVAFPVSSQAATPVDMESKNIKVWADPENKLTQANIEAFNNGTSKTAVVGTVQPYQISTTTSSGSTGGLGGFLPGTGSGGTSTSSDYYFFLPSNADCNALKLWVASGSTLTVDGVAVTSGVPTNVLADANNGGEIKDHTFNIDGKDYKVKVLKSGDVGTVYIDTSSGSLSNIYKSKGNHENGMIMVVQPDGTVDYMGVMDKMNGRGNGTWSSSNSKNPYSIKLAKSTSLLGMGKAKKWALLASTGTGKDTTLVANQLAYDFSDYIGIKYQVHCKPVDLYVNQQYLGSYQLAEKVEIKSNRVGLQSDVYENLELANATVDQTTGAIIPADFEATKPSVTNGVGTVSSLRSTLNIGGKKYSPSIANNPADITGGYIYQLEISKRLIEEENNGFCGYNKQCWVISSADYATKEMIDYSYDLFYALGSSVYNKGVVTGATAAYNNKKWSDLLDADSAVKYYWTQEFFKNMDSSTSSTYFYKESDDIDSKLYAGPVWDMDNSMGHSGDSSRWGVSLTSTDKWYTKNVRIYRYQPHKANGSSTSDPLSFYAALATNCTDFWAMAERYWYNKISPAVDILLGKRIDETGTLRSINDYVNTVAKSGFMDSTRHGTATYSASSVADTLNTWISGRQTWINKQFTTDNISTASVAIIPTQYYTGREITPELTVTYNDSTLGTLTLTEGVDYEVVYRNNINTGVATAVITGINGYTGSKEINFTIVSNKLNNATLTIDSAAYAGTQLNAVLIDVNGVDITDLAAYQWYKDNTAIAGANSSTYTVSADDAPSTIKVVASDGSNAGLSSSCTSNNCTVYAGQRPTGYDRVIASWDYDYTADSSALVNGDATGSTYYYVATGGENQATSNLYASVDADNYAAIEWSGKNDLYKNSDVLLGEDRAPVMGTSKTSGVAWGFFPYFETVVSTAGYENIKFSAKLGGSNKAPKYWNLQYSLDGIEYIDIDDTYTEIVKNKNMELIFDNVMLPQECDNQLKVYIRATVFDDVAIDGVSEIVMQQNGDAAINNVKITGASLSAVTMLYAPTINEIENNVAYDDTTVTIKDNNGGADIYYTVNGGAPVKYTGAFNPFDSKTAKVGDTAVISAYSKFDNITSDSCDVTVTFAGVNINEFSYSTYSKDVTVGAVASTGGVYGESGRMTAYADGTSQYVPLWREDNGSFSVSPDDGAKWSADSGFTYKISTAGYENVNFSCKAYTTTSGPKSVTLQYSLDGRTFTDVGAAVNLTANKMLEQAFLTVNLPAECSDKATVYVRLATKENSTFAGGTLHNAMAKGNLYVNDVIIAGEDNGKLKMPYTNKSTSYFGATGVIEYISPDNAMMNYVVYDTSDPANPTQVMGGVYSAPGIQLSNVNGFSKVEQKPYTVIIWAVDDDENTQSAQAGGQYYYKGETVVKFNYNDKDPLRTFENFVSTDGLTATQTSGVNSGTLSMYPDGQKRAIMTYTDKYGVKVANSLENRFTSNKTINKVDGNGFWLIETSSKGFTNLTLNAEQLSSNNGPRDWGIAYSLDGKTYKYLDNSNARAISNDAAGKPVETYGNIALPSECDDKDKLYIKIFINGGEGVEGDELEALTNGNTGLNGFEINGISTPIEAQINTTLLESVGAATGSINVKNVDVYINNQLQATTDENGMATVMLAKGENAIVTLKREGIATKTVTIKAVDSSEVWNIAVMAYDVNNDGYVNAKDFAIISKESEYSAYKPYFNNFINVQTDTFKY